MNCAMCKDEAAYKSHRVLQKGRHQYISYVCEKHKEEGLDFGWLEEEELEGLNGGNLK